MKKYVSILFAAVLAAGLLAGCGSKESKETSDQGTAKTTVEASTEANETSSTVQEPTTQAKKADPNENWDVIGEYNLTEDPTLGLYISKRESGGLEITADLGNGELTGQAQKDGSVIRGVLSPNGSDNEAKIEITEEADGGAKMTVISANGVEGLSDGQILVYSPGEPVY